MDVEHDSSAEVSYLLSSFETSNLSSDGRFYLSILCVNFDNISSSLVLKMYTAI